MSFIHNFPSFPATGLTKVSEEKACSLFTKEGLSSLALKKETTGQLAKAGGARPNQRAFLSNQAVLPGLGQCQKARAERGGSLQRERGGALPSPSRLRATGHPPALKGLETK